MNKYLPSPDFIAALAIIVLFASIAYAVISTVAETREYVSQNTHIERTPLPEKCAPFYNDGTERWIECMGVGRK